MKAVVIVQRVSDRGPTLEYQTVPDPVPEPSELLVSVKAAGINRIDLRRSAAHGGPAAGKPLIAGLEMAGEVVEVGASVDGFKVGDRVMAMTTGSYAELVAVDHRVAMKVPPSLSFDEAAAVATVYPTAHDALVTKGLFSATQTLLIQGVRSAVGIATLQIAKAMKARITLGTGREHPRTAQLASLGLDRFLKRGTDDIPAEAMRLTAGNGVDVVVDMLGGTAFASSVASVALGGRIVVVGFMGGRKDEIDLDEFARKRITLIGVTFRTRSLAQKAELFARFQKDVFPLFETGAVRPIVEAVYPLAEASKAQEYVASDRHLGKVLLRP